MTEHEHLHNLLTEAIAQFPDEVIQEGWRQIAVEKMSELLMKTGTYLGIEDTKQLLLGALDWLDCPIVVEKIELERTAWEGRIELARMIGGGK